MQLRKQTLTLHGSKDAILRLLGLREYLRFEEVLRRNAFEDMREWVIDKRNNATSPRTRNIDG
jgi:hypothetical protein